MSFWFTCPLIMIIPFVIIGLVLFINRKRLKDDFKANPNAWWSGCFWIGLPIVFLAACFVGWIGLGTISYYLLPRSPYAVWFIPVQLLVIHLVVIGIGVLLMVIGRKKQVKA